DAELHQRDRAALAPAGLAASLQPLGETRLRGSELAPGNIHLTQNDESGRHPVGVPARAEPLQALLGTAAGLVQMALVDRELGSPEQRPRAFRRGGEAGPLQRRVQVAAP